MTRTIPFPLVSALVALIGFHLVQEDSHLNTAPAIHLFCIAVLLLAMGSGKHALDKPN